jgi:hypothetical protein
MSDARNADEPVDADTRSQIVERLKWSPAQRLAYLRQQLAFERRAQQARRVD